MEKYSRAVSEMYSQFKKREAHPLEKYIGRLVSFSGKEVEVVGYNHKAWADKDLLIVDASQVGGWPELAPSDVVFKNCDFYYYVGISDLID